MSACQADEYDSLNCSVRAPNFALAEKLLERGERVEVLRHLVDCQNVWQFLKPQIAEWVSVIEIGKRPDIQTAEVLLPMNQPSVRLKMQWMSACSLLAETASVAPKSVKRKSPAEVLAGRERLRAEQERHLNAIVKKKIGYLDE